MSRSRDKKVAATRREPECYIKPAELLCFENESLQKMATTVPWPTRLTPWKAILLQAVAQSRNLGALRVHLSFEAPDPRSGSETPLHIVELGANISPKRAEVSYFFAISKIDNKLRRGLRKIDFDLDSMSETDEPKPTMHTQISGRRPPSMDSQHYPDSFAHLLPKLDKPRIVCLPKSFAMLTHMALLEYYSTDSGIRNIVSDPTWLAVVRAAEERMLRPHFEFCLNWLGKTDSRSRSLLSRFYGLPKGLTEDNPSGAERTA